ncbi:MAG: hypothetical protein ABI675_12840 [Chitinophagaceae bacterium]
MKRVLIAVLALLSFSVASFAQTAPAVKKNEPAKTQAVKKATDEKALALNKTTKSATPALVKTPATGKAALTTKPVAKVNAPPPLKKDGTPDKRFKANQGVAAGPLKKDGTPDKRYKANKKQN